MNGSRWLVVAKIAAVVGFLLLVLCTYGLRSEVLKLNRVQFAAEEARADQRLKEYRDSHDQRMADYDAAMKRFELEQQHYQKQREHYDRMLGIYREDLERYTQLVKDGALQFPPLPSPPQLPAAPKPPGEGDRMEEIRADFARQKLSYFETTSSFNWLACVGALLVCGGLLACMLFDAGPGRLFYLLALLLSFVFLIGPAFHSILTGIAGLLRLPG